MRYLPVCTYAKVDGPTPLKLDSDTVTVMPVEWGHNDEATSNMCVHSSFLQYEAGIVAEPHTLPEFSWAYIILKVLAKLSLWLQTLMGNVCKLKFYLQINIKLIFIKI